MLTITPETHVGELLEAFPQLEPVLMEIDPSFRKLNNPILRRTVAKVATLQQAARMAGLAPSALVRQLRQAVGQKTTELDVIPSNGAAVSSACAACTSTPSAPEAIPAPAWATDAAVAATIDADELLATGTHPLAVVQQHLRALNAGQVVCLRSTFRPVPLLEALVGQGFEVHLVEESPQGFRTLIRRSPAAGS